jgi:hypothetical protein
MFGYITVLLQVIICCSLSVSYTCDGASLNCDFAWTWISGRLCLTNNQSYFSQDGLELFPFIDVVIVKILLTIRNLNKFIWKFANVAVNNILQNCAYNLQYVIFSSVGRNIYYNRNGG